MSTAAVPYILLLGFLFGSTLIASRFSVGQFHPTTYIWLRMALASLGHAGVYLLGHRQWPADPQLWRRAALLGVLGTAIPMTSIVTSLQYQSAGLTSILLTAGPAVTVVMAHFFLPDEPLSGRKSAGVILALGGGVLLALRGESGLPDVTRASPVGYGLVLLAILTSSGMTIYARKYMQSYNAFDVASVRMLAATLTVAPLSLVWVGFDLSRVTGVGYFALGYAALVGTFLGMLVAFYNIKRFGATAAAMALYIIPAVAGIGGVLVLGETITLWMLAGLALIAGGIWLINRTG
ncbi:MAG: DMT family transporter [Chloroflexi bacterium]|nr:MAG: DMT family transporter [Chloroflexota bacterium]